MKKLSLSNIFIYTIFKTLKNVNRLINKLLIYWGSSLLFINYFLTVRYLFKYNKISKRLLSVTKE